MLEHELFAGGLSTKWDRLKIVYVVIGGWCAWRAVLGNVSDERAFAHDRHHSGPLHVVILIAMSRENCLGLLYNL